MKNHPLYKQIQVDILGQIKAGKLRPGDRVPSEKELAELYRVSQITSKNALIGLADEGVLVRVQGKGTFVRQHGEAATAVEVPSGARDVIGLILPCMKTKVDQKILDSIEKYVTASGYNLQVRITRESQVEESAAIESMVASGVRGLIVFPTEEERYNDSILRLSLDKFPHVLIDRFLKEIRTYSVSSDNVNGTEQAITHLLDNGHEHIALITPEITNTATEERLIGFEKAYLTKKLPIDKDLWCILKIEDISNGNAQPIIESFMSERPAVSAAFVVNVELTNYTYYAAKRLRKSVPDDMELVCFDQPDFQDVSYLQQNEDEICRVTVELLHAQLQGEYEPQRIVVPVKFCKK
ncbi:MULTISPECIES: GntR family transcriptional regulator [Bacillales]|jgi:DNA-binding LacI/PurR family transcriptional regulator|uniref:GntR family transcriptional regulator n=1 Tax=Bacillales TaxID=1385 RepID=UPI0006A79099|nr:MULTISPECIES: GntR family transcriptional regulator [Bacillales]OBZ12897.1 GntR family transcriptional regulator [Bacillus sp. FJAT-26390]